MKKSFGILISFFLLATLGGCLPGEGWGGTILEVRYPSGYVWDSHTWDETVPVEGTRFSLGAKRGEDFEKNRRSDLLVLDEQGQELFSYPSAGFSVLRGEAAEEGCIWVSSERWKTPHYNGYVSGRLTESVLFLLDTGDGAVLYEQKLEKNELFLTARGSKCYFYDCGSESQRKLFGLYEIPAQSARVYYRDQENWQERVLVHEFDYCLEPEQTLEGSVEDRISFDLQQDWIVVSLSGYVQTDSQTNAWEYVETDRVVIPLEVAGMKESAEIKEPTRTKEPVETKELARIEESAGTEKSGK